MQFFWGQVRVCGRSGQSPLNERKYVSEKERLLGAERSKQMNVDVDVDVDI